MDESWKVYILRCGDGSLYTGITKDISARLEQHRSGNGVSMKKIWSVYCFLEWYDVYFGEHAA